MINDKGSQMSFFLVDKKTGNRFRKPQHLSAEVYPTERGAKIACTKLNAKLNKTGWVRTIYTVMSATAFRAMFPVKMVERTNLMSGKKYMEAEDTPLSCSPASETYWSM